MRPLTPLRILGRLLRGDNETRYLLAERLARRLHPEAILPDKGRLWLHDEQFRAAYRRFGEAAPSRRMDRIWTVDQLAAHVVASGVAGDTAECGVYVGAASWFIARRIASTGKTHHGFDSFEGLSAPTATDGDYWHQGDLATPEEVARCNLSEFCCVKLYKGWIPERFHEVGERRFSFVHVDVDLYKPTSDSINFFWPRLNPGGVIVFDDYGFLNNPGAQRATDEYNFGAPVLCLSTGQAAVWKPCP